MTDTIKFKVVFDDNNFHCENIEAAMPAVMYRQFVILSAKLTQLAIDAEKANGKDLLTKKRNPAIDLTFEELLKEIEPEDTRCWEGY